MYLWNIYIICLILNTSSALFISWLRNKLSIRKPPQYMPKYIQEPHKKQFFGMIGPNIHPENVKTLFDLFTGDGIIHGVFINGKNITFTKHLIQTEKIKNEENLTISEIQLSEKLETKLFKYFNYLIGFQKWNNLGVANTAILPLSQPVDENTTAAYALFERDKPYLLHFYHNTSTISTIGKVNTSFCLSGHSKKVINTLGEHTIETIDYHIFQKKVMYYSLDENLTQVLSSVEINTRYIPIIHDFLSTKDNIVIIDSPLFLDLPKLCNGKLPIKFDKQLPTFIHVIHKNTGSISTYKVNSAFYVFHFAKYTESYNQIEIYAPMYDDIDFDSINIKGKYRKIVIDRYHKTAYVCNNVETEKYNLDFPVIDAFGDVILRNIERRKINGFVKTDSDMSITQKWMFNDIFFCGEPISVCFNRKNGLIAFGNMDNVKESNNTGGIVLLNMEDGTVLRYQVGTNLTMGFHTVSISR